MIEHGDRRCRRMLPGMQPENLESRVTALEVQVRDLTGRVRASEHNATAARVLAGAADREVGEIRDELRDFRRATIGSFNALRQDMTDGFRRIDERFARIDERFTHIDERFTRIDEQFTRIDERFTRIDERFTHIDERFAHIDARFTRIDERFTSIDKRFTSIDEQFAQVGNGFAEMRAKFDMTAAGQQRIVELIQIVIDAQGRNDPA